MARKIVDHIKKNKVTLDQDPQQLVASVTNQRKPQSAAGEPAQQPGNPFGGFQVRKPGEGARMAQGGMSR